MKRHSFGSDSACHVLGLASVMGFVALALCSGAKLLTKFHIRGLSGSWNASSESLVLQAVPGKIVFRFHSRDLHLMQALAKDAKPVRFVVRLDGAAPAIIASLTLPRTAPGKFASPGSISSSGKKVQSWAERSRSNSSILAFRPLTSRLVRVVAERNYRPLSPITKERMTWHNLRRQRQARMKSVVLIWPAKRGSRKAA
jgi:hypothetical protein